MLLNEFPDINWLKKAIQTNFSDKRSWDNKPLPNLGWPTAILNVKTNEAERKDIKGPFSLFLNISGKSQVTCDRKTIELSSNTYISSNHGQHYDLLVNSTNTETFNIHFGEKLYQDTLHVLQKSNEDLLDYNSFSQSENNQAVRSIFRDNHFNSLVAQVKVTYQNDEKETSLHELLSYVLIENNKHLKQIQDFDEVRVSTKEELIKRVYLAVDFIHAYYNHQITLDDVAEVAMLSKFHFLRVFKAIFKLSPHQYIKQIRLQKAIEMIGKNQLPLYLIAQEVGLENGSSLSRMIFQLTGKRPTSFTSN